MLHSAPTKVGSVENAFTLKYGSTTLFFFPYISEVCITINIDAEEGSLCLEASGNKVCGSYLASANTAASWKVTPSNPQRRRPNNIESSLASRKLSEPF